MKLSMSMLAWYMRNHDPQAYIQNDTQCIQGVRFHQDETRTFKPEYLYFSQADEWFEDPKYKGAYLIAQGESTIFFWNSEHDELLNSLLSAFDYFNNWEHRLLEAASRHAPLSAILSIADEVINNPVAILEGSGRLLASVLTGFRHQDEFWSSMIREKRIQAPVFHDLFYDSRGNLIRDFTDAPKLVQNVYPGSSPVLMMYMKQNDTVLAGIGIMQENPAMTEVNRQILPELVRYMLQAEEFVEHHGSARPLDYVIKDLLQNRTVGEINLQRIVQKMPELPWRAVILKHITRSDLFARSPLVSSLEKCPQIAFPMVFEDIVFAIASDKLWEEGFQSLNLDYYCTAVSMPFTSISEISMRYQQARFTLDQANCQEGRFCCEEFAFHYLLSNLRQHELTSMLLHPALEKLDAHDKVTQGDLHQTLSTFLDCQQSLVDTSAKLHIHNNTLKYRLRRIREITGLTLEDTDELKYLRLSDWLCRD